MNGSSLPKPSDGALVTDVAAAVERPASRGWWAAFGLSLAGVAVLVVSLADVVAVGTGEWGINNAVGWAWDITGFVFWVGIAHAGTLLSAVLFLLRQTWRSAVSRAAVLRANCSA